MDNVEVYKQKVYISCQNMVTVAENAIRNHPELKKAVVMEHAPRFDENELDPTGLKPNLAKFANFNLANMCQNSAFKDKITLGKHSLDCDIGMLTTRYRDERTGRYDGVHMNTGEGRKAHTDSVSLILERTVLPGSMERLSATL